MGCNVTKSPQSAADDVASKRRGGGAGRRFVVVASRGEMQRDAVGVDDLPRSPVARVDGDSFTQDSRRTNHGNASAAAAASSDGSSIAHRRQRSDSLSMDTSALRPGDDAAAGSQVIGPRASALNTSANTGTAATMTPLNRSAGPNDSQTMSWSEGRLAQGDETSNSASSHLLKVRHSSATTGGSDDPPGNTLTSSITTAGASQGERSSTATFRERSVSREPEQRGSAVTKVNNPLTFANSNQTTKQPPAAHSQQHHLPPLSLQSNSARNSQQVASESDDSDGDVEVEPMFVSPLDAPLTANSTMAFSALK